MNDENENSDLYENITLDNSIEDEQFHQSIEDAERYRAGIQETQAQARAFDEVVDSLDALADSAQETYEETRADPYQPDIDYNGPQYEQVADGLFIGVAAGVLMADKASQAWNDWGDEQEDTDDSDTDAQLDEENAVLEDALENDMSQWEETHEAMDSSDEFTDNNDYSSETDWVDDPFADQNDFDDNSFEHDAFEDSSFDDGGFDDGGFDDGDMGDDF